VEEAVASVGAEYQDQVRQMVSSCAEHMNPRQLTAAAADIKQNLGAIEGAGVLAGVGGALSSAADMAGPVSVAVGGILLEVGQHMPMIGAAAGVLGIMIKLFEDSKINDKNVETVKLWSASVKDWLLLVAGRVAASGAESTVPLFVGLQEALEGMYKQIDKQSKKWRIGKMLSSGTFARDFKQAKEAVLELKTALRDYLDQEAQDAQEKKLESIEAANLETAQKLETMDAQLGEIKALLQAQADVAAAEAEKKGEAIPTGMDEEEQIYVAMQSAAGVEAGAPLKFNDFTMAFESFFLKGDDLAPEVKRGMKIALDRENKNRVSKLSWIKFYRSWKGSELSMQDYLQSIAADAPPTMFAVGADWTNETYAAIEEAINQVKDAAAEHLESGKVKAEAAKAAATEKMEAGKAAAAEAAAAAKEKAGNMMGGMFGKKKQ